MTEPTSTHPSPTTPDLSWSEEWVPLSEVIKHQPLQARKKLDGNAVTRYASMTKEGSKPPPIKLARCDGKLYLLDGWHRMEAGALQLQTDLTAGAMVLAVVAAMSTDRMPWEAARANVGNGVQYKSGEFRPVFRAFIKSKQHHKGRREYMTYREMAAALGLGVSHVTLFKWTAADFPKLAAALSSKDYGNEGAGTYTPQVKTMEEQHNDEAHKALEALSQHAGALDSAVNRWEVLQRLEATSAMLRAKGVEAAEF
jgi:hypothetical protein